MGVTDDDRGAAVIYTSLRLTSRSVFTRSLQLPAPMRDPKTLRTLILQLLSAGTRLIAVDLTATDFVDSTGLGMLVAALKRVRTHDGELVVVCPDPRLRRIFELTELVSVFGLRHSVDELPEFGA